jgi:hypothetical protein
MVSYRAKGINKFTFVNLRLLGSNRRGGIFLLAALVSTGSRTATAGCCAAAETGWRVTLTPDAEGGELFSLCLCAVRLPARGLSGQQSFLFCEERSNHLDFPRSQLAAHSPHPALFQFVKSTFSLTQMPARPRQQSMAHDFRVWHNSH